MQKRMFIVFVLALFFLCQIPALVSANCTYDYVDGTIITTCEDGSDSDTPSYASEAWKLLPLNPESSSYIYGDTPSYASEAWKLLPLNPASSSYIYGDTPSYASEAWKLLPLNPESPNYIYGNSGSNPYAVNTKITFMGNFTTVGTLKHVQAQYNEFSGQKFNNIFTRSLAGSMVSNMNTGTNWFYIGPSLAYRPELADSSGDLLTGLLAEGLLPEFSG